ncbi:ATP-binding protein [Pseudanabaena sp. FACHB-1998]|uniref:AAA family ATPase n=1 Tax=Pseudanabaena sp. FACHB-1998 TaxID=2692858 RepID=UPI0016806A1E|nr:AAA family ATPase [Pseudanabaena sp. FACHB-1998]MBD2177137.1 ATP-binding protein [Pseudanabaena sp. FACHB-1998]
MQLKQIKFSRFKGSASEWSVEGRPINGQFGQWLELNNVNLITGRNASGKSRTIFAIRHIADLFSGDVDLSRLHALGYGTAEYQLTFNSDENNLIEYFLNFENGEIIQEQLIENREEKLNRTKGKLWYEGLGDYLDFEVDRDVLAISKRDKKQHPFFEKLHSWGDRLNFYRFGGQLGKNALLKDINAVTLSNEKVDLKDGDEVTGIFVKAKKQFPESFVAAIIKDMNYIAYHLNSVDVIPLKNFPVTAYGLAAYEMDLNHQTDQQEMSQGMFRALSLLIQLNYAILTREPSCILIDDIGEGLDFERSQYLIELILDKFKNSSVQVIMTTNDRVVMNKIPLEYWQAIERVPNKSLFYNYQNARDIFDDYRHSGLSNFDFLKTGFYITGFEGEEEE